MTFVEAAVEILKREGKPLSSRRLAELAVKLNLLSVVGRDPGATMQERLDDALEHGNRHPDLVRLKPDTFGLHAYPAQPYPANGTQAHATAAAAGDGSGGEQQQQKKPRRRRGRRGGDVAGVDETAAAGEADAGGDAGSAEAAGGDAGDEGGGEGGEGGGESGGEGEGGGEGAEPGAAAGEAGAPTGEKRRRRRRGGRGRRRREGEPADDTGGEAARPAEAAHQPPSEAAAAGTPPDEVAEIEAGRDVDAAPGEAAAAHADGGDTAEEAEDDVDEIDEIDEHTGPLLAPALGAEDVTRTEDDRTIRPEIRGSREDRRHHRGDRHKERRDRNKERKGHDQKPHEPRAHEQKPHEPRAHDHKPHEPRAPERGHEQRPHDARPHEPRPHEPRPSSEPRTGGLIDILLDVLRASDGRPMHVRHLVDSALKRRVVDDKSQPAEFVRLARAALVREQRDREADGLRPRIRALGGGNYATVDRKLDPELMQAERDLVASAGRLRDATRAAVRRRLGRMAPAAFDALGRTLADKLGIGGLELLRRGEGVTYWGGTRPRGVSSTRVLIALRPGEGEINRRAVGELRAGLAAKGYDEGLLLGAGRPNAEALAELKQGGVTLYDGASLASLLVKHGLGVRRVTMPVDYLDLDFFFELSEG